MFRQGGGSYGKRRVTRNKNPNMTEPKHPHYIPQLLARRFTDDRGKLHCFRKGATSEIFCTTPEKVFRKKDLHTTYNKQGEKDNSVETTLSKIESDAAPVIEKIVNAVRNRYQLSLTKIEKEAWDKFLCCQAGRLPEALEMLENSRDEFKCKLEQSALNDLGRPLTDYGRNYLNYRLNQPDTIREAWAKSLKLRAESAGDLLRVLGNKSLGIGIVGSPRKSFIIGSNPIIKIVPSGFDLSHPSAELLLPISHDVVVSACSLSGERSSVVEITSDRVRQINEYVFRSSDMIAGRSYDLIKSLSHTR